MNWLKTIVVVGASSQVGQEISLKLASEGYNLLLTYNDSLQKIVDLEKEINKRYKVKLLKVKLNLFSENYIQLIKVIENLPKEHLLGMVFCAGFTPERNHFRKISIDQVKKAFFINVISAYEIISIITKKMKLNTDLDDGSIVLISSQIAKFGSNGISAYVASKGGLNSLGISLAKELGPEKIRVNIISPGPIETDKSDQKVLSNLKKSMPLGRCCAPQDIANMVAFLFSKESKFLNGVDIPLNGGR